MEWISVKDRMPPVGEDVWVAKDDNVYLTAHFYNEALQAWMPYGEAYETVGITHWMPLPEPPKN